MKRYMSLVVVPIFALAACGDDNKTSSDADSTSDTTADTSHPDTTVPDTTPGDVTPGTSALTGVNTNVQVTTPTPNAGCDATKVDNGVNGAKYPWGGLTAGGVSYTCNSCPTGLKDFQGKWRAHGFAADGTTPDYSQGADATNDDAELFYIDGNTWYDDLHDQQEQQSVETRGWFFCSQQPENPHNHLFWVSTEAKPDGGLGAHAGDINESDVVLSSGADNKLIIWFDEVGGATNVQIGYCKIGTSSNGQTCNNPFE